MSARQKTIRKRKKYTRSYKGQSKKSLQRYLVRFIKYSLVIIILAFGIVYLNSPTDYWDGEEKLSVSYPRSDGSVGVAIFDPRHSEITVVLIPANTEVATARWLGVWKVKSLWELSENEDLKGVLLSETITNRMQMPVNAWADNKFEFVVEGTSKDIFPGIFSISSNLGFKDRIKIGFFSLSVKNARFKVVNLGNTPFLKKVILTDGSDGYSLFGSISHELSAVFTANMFSNTEVTARIVNRSDRSIDDGVGQALQTVGIKVAAIKKEISNESDCVVRGRNENYINLVARLFKCDTDINADLSSFDIEFEFGNKFAQRF